MRILYIESMLLSIDKLGRKGEKHMKTGFTLIELLVVVLIIGILAAIAVPQYQKAVERSRTAEALQVLGDWANAQSIYHMQHNAFAYNINEGDITLPEPGGAFEYELDGDGVNIAILRAERASGMYAGGLLAIGVESDGTIHKGCQNPADKTGFCTLVESAGYSLENLGGGSNNDKDCPSGMVNVDGACIPSDPR